jgi:molybdopterin-binding protein
VDPAARYENVLAGALEPRAGVGETAVFHANGARLIVPAPPAEESHPGRTVFSIAPEDILVSAQPPERVSARNRLFGRVVAVREADDGTWLRVEAEGIPWTVRLTRAAEEELALSPGTSVWLTIKAHSFRRLA